MALGPPSVIDMLQPGRLGLSLADQGGRNLALNEGFCTQSRTIWPRTNGTWCRHNLRPDVRSGPEAMTADVGYSALPCAQKWTPCILGRPADNVIYLALRDHPSRPFRMCSRASARPKCQHAEC